MLQERIGDFQEALRNPAFSDLAKQCEINYWHWDKLKFIARSKKLDPQLVWAFVKLGRQPRYRVLPLRGYSDQRLRFNLPDAVQRELMLIDQQLAGHILARDESPLTTSQQERFIINAFHEEAIASSMLEGAATTRRDAKRMLRTHRKPRSRGEQMVLNNYRAILFIREHRDTDLSPDFLLELQTILTRNTLDDVSGVGRFRVEDDNIQVVDARDNEVVHDPPPASELEGRLNQLCDFANNSTGAEEFIHPVIRACILHFQLAFDHPFCDGNGRTARALFYWEMLRRGYWLFEHLPISRLIYRGPAKYIRAFLYSETDECDITYFLVYHMEVVAKARQELREWIAHKQAQMAQARRLFRSDRRLNHRQHETVLQAARNPNRPLTISEHQIKHAVAYATARNDLLELADWGYLDQHQVGNRYEFTAGPKLQGADAQWPV
ncbi:MAG: Fic family protein [Phycisphaeraceae bacterium]